VAILALLGACAGGGARSTDPAAFRYALELYDIQNYKECAERLEPFVQKTSTVDEATRQRATFFIQESN
jgi:hypothetical protein